MDNETAVIKHQMLETRTALTEKLEALEERVTSTVRETTEAVEETVEAVKDAVENTVQAVTGTVTDTVETVKESVKESFDLTRQFNNHPWTMLGGSVFLGYLGGCLLDRARPVACPPPSNGWAAFNGGTSAPQEPARPTKTERPASPSLWDKAIEALGPPMEKLEGIAIGAAASLVGKMILEAAPEALRQDLGEAIKDFTTALGGKPMPELLRPDEQDQAGGAFS